MDTSIKRLLEVAGVDITKGKAKELCEAGTTSHHKWSDDYHSFDNSSYEEVVLDQFGYKHNGKTMLSYLGLSKELDTDRKKRAYLKSIESELNTRGFNQVK